MLRLTEIRIYCERRCMSRIHYTITPHTYDTIKREKKIQLTLIKKDTGIHSRSYFFFFFVVFVSVWVSKGMCSASHMPVQGILSEPGLRQE